MLFRKKKGLTLSFYIAIPIILLVIILALVFKENFANFTASIKDFISVNFGWYYLLLVGIIVILCFVLIALPIGKIKLGDPNSKPEHGMISWIAMLFSAGMGIGLVFYGAAEPLSHFAASAPEAKLYSEQALSDAFKYSFFHYGIHAWAVYAIVALALAYFRFRKKERFLISATLKPLFGKKMDGIAGKIIDSITIVATTAGVATSLGYGAAQINGGLNFLFDAPLEFWVELIIIIIATVLFLTSALSGIGKGVKYLSNANVIIATILMVVALFIGPTTQIMNTGVDSLGNYLRDFLQMGFKTAPNNAQEQEWIQRWTILYWSWWISWSPFVGVFIARISKGRTIREFLVYVLLVPSLFSFAWFSVFGVLSTNAVAADHSLANLEIQKTLFATFDTLKGGQVLSIIAIILVFSFFITFADSATYVLAMQSENGTLVPKKITKLVWGISISLIAIILLRAGGLDSLQNFMIIIGFPFSIIIILLMISFVKEVLYEQKQMGLTLSPERYPEKTDPFRSYDLTRDEKKELREKRIRSIKRFLKTKESISIKDVSKKYNISYQAAKRLLYHMYDDKILDFYKEGRIYKFVLNKKHVKPVESLKNEQQKTE